MMMIDVYQVHSGERIQVEIKIVTCLSVYVPLGPSAMLGRLLVQIRGRQQILDLTRYLLYKRTALVLIEIKMIPFFDRLTIRLRRIKCLPLDLISIALTSETEDSKVTLYEGVGWG